MPTPPFTAPSARAAIACASLRVRPSALPPEVLAGLLLGKMRMRPAYGRRDDLVRDVKIPDRGAACCGELGDELRHVGEVLDRLSRKAESARDAGQIAVAEHR